MEEARQHPALKAAGGGGPERRPACGRLRGARRTLIVALAAAALAGGAFAQGAEPDTAAAQAAGPGADAAICTDRPGKASAPCTVEAGRLQLESDLFDGAFLRQGGVTTDVYFATNPTLKYGLNEAVDLEVGMAPYAVVRTHDKSGASSTLGGVGDLYFRLKYNVCNARDDAVQLALIPYVKAPTARGGIGNGEVEAGVVAPMAVKLGDRLTLTTAPEVDAYADLAGGGHHVNTAQLVSAAYDLTHGVTAVAELWGDWNFDPAGEVDQYSADVAVARVIGKTLQLDGGLDFGLNRETPGVQAYVGVSQRF